MKPAFPATYSTLCPIALASLISEKYETGNVQCKFLVRGVGDTYLVESSKDRFILRVYRSSHRNLPQIKEEVELLLALKQADVSVSYPIPDVSGEAIQQLEAVEGNRYAVLFNYAPGRTVRIMNENQLRTLGHEMARFHNVSSTIGPGGARWNFDPETTLLRPLEILKPAFAEDPEGYAWLRQAVAQAVKKLSSLNTAGFSKGYCHFDFLPKNFHFEGDSVTFFDFDFMGYGWLVNDIMSFWQHLILDVYNGRTTQPAANDAYSIFLDGYREHRPVSEEELAAVPYLSLGFWLFYMGFHTTHDQFYAFSQPSQVKLFTGILRHIAATYWDKEGDL
ncbi:phosphotransferase [Pseudoflavitalea sp. X16]|uniref:phosphotransferase enzyme family protein n=1 Tax=Paraflavitalea devenefica TaxID=2716334 RepID=UPI001421B442|nr:phosphotransferase [Paraflavitalea devenefica]NII26090.1 phosphotransferase [Paraflavitalea devenefica]